MMRRFALGTLLVIMPFGGIRVMCVDSPRDVGLSSAPTETGANCERLCPLHQPSMTDTESSSDCALSADASSLNVFASIAALRPQGPLQEPSGVAPTYADSPRFYLEPELAHPGPPPKLRTL